MVQLLSNDYFNKKIGFSYVLYEKVQVVEPHNHDYYEIFIILSNHAIHTINGEAETLAPGTIYFIQPDDVHSFRSMPESSFKMLNIMYSCDSVNSYSAFLDPQNPSAVLTQLRQAHALIPTSEMNKIMNFLKKISDYSNPSNCIFLNKSLLASLIHYLFQTPAEMPKTDFPLWLSELLFEMQKKENFIAGIPALLNISKKSHGYLCSAFEKYLQCSPSEYVNSLRLNNAMFLLLNTDHSILDIALDSGFNNIGYFIKKFREHYYVTPSVYRKLHQIPTEQ